MCTLAVFTAVLPGLPLLVAANRDEFYARPAVTPEGLAEGRALGGRDLVAGGSWLALGRSEVVIGVLNRRARTPPDATRTSRGLLCVELACADSARAAVEILRERDPEAYNPFSLLVADRGEAFVARNRGDRMDVEPLAPGLHVLTNLDVDDGICPRISRSTGRFQAVGRAFADGRDESALVAGLREVLADHNLPLDDRAPEGQLCIHTDAYGTRSSSLILFNEDRAPRFLHADGPPCRAGYEEVPLPWSEDRSTR